MEGMVLGSHREGAAPGCDGCSKVSAAGKVKESTCFHRGSSWEDAQWLRFQCLGNWASAKENLQPPTKNERSAIAQRLPKEAAGHQEAQSKALRCQGAPS